MSTKSKVKDLLSQCVHYSWEQFNKDYRVITDENLELVAQLYGYESWEDMYKEYNVSIVGLYAYIDYEEVYQYNKNDPERFFQLIINASQQLKATPSNIPEDVKYEDVEILWAMGGPGNDSMRVFPHSILDFMEPEGEGDTELEHVDYVILKLAVEG